MNKFLSNFHAFVDFLRVYNQEKDPENKNFSYKHSVVHL